MAYSGSAGHRPFFGGIFVAIRSVVFVRNDAAQSRLAFLDLHTREVTEIAPVERTQQVYTPRWSCMRPSRSRASGSP